MGNSSYMPELQHDPSTCGVHLVDDSPPRRTLFVGMDPGRVGVSDSRQGDLSAPEERKFEPLLALVRLGTLTVYPRSRLTNLLIGNIQNHMTDDRSVFYGIMSESNLRQRQP